MGGLISKDGITKDLEALERAGVGGVLIMQMPDQWAGVVQSRYRDYPGKVKCLSEDWFAMMNHAAKERVTEGSYHKVPILWRVAYQLLASARPRETRGVHLASTFW